MMLGQCLTQSPSLSVLQVLFLEGPSGGVKVPWGLVHTHTLNIQDLSTRPSKFGYATIIIYYPYPLSLAFGVGGNM